MIMTESVDANTLSPFSDPNYGKDAEAAGHVITGHPVCSLENNQNRLTGWVGTGVILAGAAVLAVCQHPPQLPFILSQWMPGWVQNSIDWSWEWRHVFIIPLVFFAMFLVEMLIAKTQRRNFDFKIARPIDSSAWKRIGARWLAVVFCLALIACLYAMLGDYSFYIQPYTNEDYLAFYKFSVVALPAIAACCVPYFWLVERHARSRAPADEFLILFGCLHRIVKGVFNSAYRADAAAAVKNAHVYNLFRGLLVKFFFVPLMLGWCIKNWENWELHSHAFITVYSPQMFSTLENIATASISLHHALFDLLFTLDVTLGLVGYMASVRLLDTQVNSAEPTLFGWMMALLCYPPFNHLLTSRYIPHSTHADGDIWTHYHPVLVIAAFAASILLMCIYTWATISFGLRFSNLTNRGIICKGPYAFVRHPAYICKNISWWIETMPLRSSSPLLFTFGLLGLNLIYGLRALTEERHLMREPHYQEYCKKVPWRFIPGVW